MAVVKISNLQPVFGRRIDFPVSTNFDQPFCYYREDISLLLAQPGAVHVMAVNAKLSGTEIKVLIAVKMIPGGLNIPDETDWLQDSDHFAALPCPKFDKVGGTELASDGATAIAFWRVVNGQIEQQ